jgi:hypothetical protein
MRHHEGSAHGSVQLASDAEVERLAGLFLEIHEASARQSDTTEEV